MKIKSVHEDNTMFLILTTWKGLDWTALSVCWCVLSGPPRSDDPPAVRCDSQHHESKMEQCGGSFWLHAAVCTAYRWWGLSRERGSGRQRPTGNENKIRWMLVQLSLVLLKALTCAFVFCPTGQGAGRSDRDGAPWIDPSHWIHRHCLCHVRGGS